MTGGSLEPAAGCDRLSAALQRVARPRLEGGFLWGCPRPCTQPGGLPGQGRACCVHTWRACFREVWGRGPSFSAGGRRRPVCLWAPSLPSGVGSWAPLSTAALHFAARALRAAAEGSKPCFMNATSLPVSASGWLGGGRRKLDFSMPDWAGNCTLDWATCCTPIHLGTVWFVGRWRWKIRRQKSLH